MIAVGTLGTYAPPGESLAVNLVWMGTLFVAAAALWALMSMGIGVTSYPDLRNSFSSKAGASGLAKSLVSKSSPGERAGQVKPIDR